LAASAFSINEILSSAAKIARHGGRTVTFINMMIVKGGITIDEARQIFRRFPGRGKATGGGGAQLLHGERDEIDGDAPGRGWEILRIVSGVI